MSNTVFALCQDEKYGEDFVAVILTSVSVEVPAHRSLGGSPGTTIFHPEIPGGTEVFWGD